MSILDTLPKSDKPGVLLDSCVVHDLLPQKDPFAFVDEVNELSEKDGKQMLTATKYILGTEGYFKGHFPTEPIMPGVLQVEAMAQAGCLLAALCYEKEIEGKRPAFMGVDACRFRRPVKPGDVLILKVVLEKFRRGIMVFSGEIFCKNAAGEEELVCNGTLTAAMV